VSGTILFSYYDRIRRLQSAALVFKLAANICKMGTLVSIGTMEIVFESKVDVGENQA
jgi:hypothetical protein